MFENQVFSNGGFYPWHELMKSRLDEVVIFSLGCLFAVFCFLTRAQKSASGASNVGAARVDHLEWFFGSFLFIVCCFIIKIVESAQCKEHPSKLTCNF